MANEFGGLAEGLDIGGSPRQDINHITEEAVQRAQEQAKKAKQAHQQTQQSKQLNNNIASFLGFLLKSLKNEALVSLLHSLFFKTKDPSTGTSYLRKKINSMVIVGFFYPFYQKDPQAKTISSFFDSLIAGEPLNLTGYINYIKRLSATYHDNVALDPDTLVDFLMMLIDYFKIQDTSSLEKEELEKLKLHIKNQLYT